MASASCRWTGWAAAAAVGTGSTATAAAFSDGVVNSALRFRAQAPLVDHLLREIGLDGADIHRLVGGVTSTALPPASRRRPPSKDE
jgi:hypothetical protein